MRRHLTREPAAPGKEGPATSHRHRSDSALGRRFARLWPGYALATSGDGFAYGAVPLLAVVVDPHPLAVSAVVAADGLPWLLASVPAGIFADRLERGRVMAVANLVRALFFGLLTALVVLHAVTLWLLILAVLGNATGRSVYFASIQAAVPDAVDPVALDKANGVLTGTEAVGEHVAGPVVGAAAFSAVSFVPFLADGAVLGLAGAWFYRTRSRTRERTGDRGSIWAGLRLLLGDRRLRLLVTLIGALAAFQGVESGVLVLLATQLWGVSSGAYGVFLAVGAVGNIPGALLADRLVRSFGSARTLVAVACVAGASYLAMATAGSWVTAGAAYLVSGFAVAAGVVSSSALRQRLTPREVMGRLGAAWRGVTWGAAPLGALLGGAVASVGGLRLALLVAGVGQLVVTLAVGPSLVMAVGSSAGRRRVRLHARARGGRPAESEEERAPTGPAWP